MRSFSVGVSEGLPTPNIRGGVSCRLRTRTLPGVRSRCLNVNTCTASNKYVRDKVSSSRTSTRKPAMPSPSWLPPYAEYEARTLQHFLEPLPHYQEFRDGAKHHTRRVEGHTSCCWKELTTTVLSRIVAVVILVWPFPILSCRLRSITFIVTVLCIEALNLATSHPP